jgi:hypothetical protein
MKLEWGKKVACAECSVKFYDLQKPRVICPVCGWTKADASDAKSPSRKGGNTLPNDFPEEKVDFSDVVFDTDDDSDSLSGANVVIPESTDTDSD